VSATIDVSRLLTIDVDAEIRKLGLAPLGSVDRIPALLATRAIRSGATSVAVRVSNRRVEVWDDARDLDAFRLVDLAVLLAHERAPRERHAALLALEGAGCTALLALASLPGVTRLQIESGPGGVTLAWRRGARPEVRDTPKSPGSRIVVEGIRISRDGARHQLTEACRFAPTRVSFDDEPLPKGFEGVIGEAPLTGALSGRVGLPQSAEGDARVWLLVHGAVMTHTSLPGLPAFLAAVELGHLGASPEPAALRDAVRPLAPALASQALTLLIRLARRPGPPGHAATLRGHLLRAARRMPAVHELRRLPCLPTAPVAGSPERLLSIAELAQQARAGVVAALFPDQDPRQYRASGAGPLLVLDASERSALDRLTGARFIAPPRRGRSSRARRLWQLLKASPARAWRAVAALAPVRPIPEPGWTEAERSLLVAVRAGLPASGPLAEVAICEGAGSPRCRGRTLWLPRHSRLVQHAATALGREGPAFGRVAALALLPRV